jgi:Glu-tRNA(Gln) amidotransferase subunit E-like FAD-binding protein
MVEKKENKKKIDYKELKFKCGLEIHQQLDSGKLFCRCPSVLRNDNPDYILNRKLHAVAGESGEVDVAALHQVSKNKEFVYEGYYDNCCLVESDEEPPREIDKDALKIAMQIGFLMNMKPIPATQIMRKTVIDGSNTSGFQRTVLIARDGFIETSKGKVGVDYLMLEEDAARIVKRESEKDVYRLDRLGIPLVEVVTAPDIKDPEHAKEVALMIGEILRSCKVRRGIGTIRQDVNVSIRDENRVEIKGMQDMNVFVKAIETEVLRQKRLSDSKNPVEMEVRNVLPSGKSEYMRPLPGSSRMYPETDLPLLKLDKKFVDLVKKDLPKLRSEVEEELRKQGLTEEMIKILFKRNKLEEYKELYSVSGNGPLIGKLLLIFPKELASKNKKNLEEVEEILNLDVLSFVLEKVYKDKLHKAHLKDVLEKVLEGIPVAEAVKIEKVDTEDVEEKVLKIIKEKPGLSANAYMGLVMKEFKGKISGLDAMEIIRKFVN